MKPFAKYYADAGRVRTFDGRIVSGPGASDSLSMLRDDLNDAALKYAADKIREAAKSMCVSSTPGVGIGFLEARRQMLARADAVERGEA